MLIDASKRDIRIPVKFLPYLEKYNIYALFHEIARQLAIAQPVDHISYMHRILKHAAVTCNVRQIILLAPPFLNMLNLAKQLATEINVTIITETEIDEAYHPHLLNYDNPDFEITKEIKKLISLKHKDCNQGWLILGYPKNKQQAMALQRDDVIPTHVLNFVPAFMADLDEPNIPQEWINYRKNLVDLRKIFSKKWHDISMTGRDIMELLRVCLDITSFNNRLKYAITPRILIIGCPGSGQKTVAKALEEKLQIVHVDFPIILNRALRNQDPKYEEYQELKTNLNMDASKISRLHTEIIMKILLDQNCVDKGWVVTGFPNTLADMKRLDKSDTPPNRIFFFDCPEEICLERLKKTTSYENIDIPTKNPVYGQEIKNKLTINAIQRNLNEISEYCGKTASHIRTDQSSTDVLNTVLALIMREAPISLEHRNPYEDYELLPRNEPRKEQSQELSHHTQEDCIFSSTNDKDSGGSNSTSRMISNCSPLSIDDALPDVGPADNEEGH